MLQHDGYNMKHPRYYRSRLSWTDRVTIALWLLLRVALAGVLLLLVAVAYFWFSTPLPTPEHLRQRAEHGTTRLLDRHGNLLYAVPNPLTEQRQQVPLAEIPRTLQQATIAIEDSTFYQTPGGDVRAMLYELWRDAPGDAQSAGSSPIVHQLVRTVVLEPAPTQPATLGRKLRELVLTIKLTSRYSHDDMLALSLNHRYYGGTSYGVEAAAQFFFGKSVRDLNRAECVLLAGLPQAPAAYNPLIAPEAAQRRQQQVLDAMVRGGYLSADEAAALQRKPLQFAPGASPNTSIRTMQAPHVVIYVLNQLISDLGTEAVLHGGLTITTTLDLPLQRAAQHSVQRHLRLLSLPPTGAPDYHVHSGAVVVLNPADGAVLAMVGSPDFYDQAIAGQVNGALTLRQPGPAIEPLAYAAALEQGWTPATHMLSDTTTVHTRTGMLAFSRHYTRTEQHELSLREALASSSTGAMATVLDKVGGPALLAMAERLGISTLRQHSRSYDQDSVLAHGGGRVTLLQLSSAYAAFANGGQRITPYTIVAVQHPHYPSEASPPAAPVNALTPEIAYLMSDMLSDRDAHMHAVGVNSMLDIDRPAAVKAGTTSDGRDNWTLGYTPQRVVGVWLGNADDSPMQGISGISGAGPVWHEVMLAAHRGLPRRPFVRPEGVIEVEICAEDGLLASPDCATPRMERFVNGTEPLVSRRERMAAGERRYRPAPQPVLIAPTHGSVFSIAADAAGADLEEQQRIELRGHVETSATETLQVTFFVDGEPLTTLTEPPYHAWWEPVPGPHTASIEVMNSEGNTARSDTVSFIVTRPGY